jgi:hypothetical protein
MEGGREGGEREVRERVGEGERRREGGETMTQVSIGVRV